MTSRLYLLPVHMLWGWADTLGRELDRAIFREKKASHSYSENTWSTLRINFLVLFSITVHSITTLVVVYAILFAKSEMLPTPNQDGHALRRHTKALCPWRRVQSARKLPDRHTAPTTKLLGWQNSSHFQLYCQIGYKTEKFRTSSVQKKTSRVYRAMKNNRQSVLTHIWCSWL